MMPPVLEFPKFSRLNALAFNLYDQFPPLYHYTLFAVLRGAVNNDPRVKSGVVALHLTPVSQGFQTEDVYFANGFTDPVDLIFDNQGNLYVADFSDGLIYIIKAIY